MPAKVFGVLSAHPRGTPLLLNNDILFRQGNGGDWVSVLRSSTLAANTALPDVLIGTPVTTALAADSIIFSNTTASGDFILALNRGGNSEEYLHVDSSAGTLTLRTHTTGNLLLLNGATELARVTSGNLWLIGDTANADMTVGLTINQGANTNQFFAAKNSGVAHGFTGRTETDTFLRALVLDANGGVILGAYKEVGAANAVTLFIEGLSATAGSVTHSTAGRSVVEFFITDVLTTGDAGNATADINLLGVRTVAAGANVTRFILDSDGDSHQDVGTAWTNFDDYDDLVLLHDLRIAVTRRNDPIRKRFGEFLALNKAQLQATRVVSFAGPTPFVNMSKLTMLHTSALAQIGERLGMLDEQMAELENAHQALTGQLRIAGILPVR